MPPKKRATKRERLDEADREDARSQIAVWMFRTDAALQAHDAWSPFDDAASAAIEAAYCGKRSCITVGPYKVDLLLKTQTRLDDSSKIRHVKRHVVGRRPPAGTQTAPITLDAAPMDRPLSRVSSASTVDVRGVAPAAVTASTSETVAPTHAPSQHGPSQGWARSTGNFCALGPALPAGDPIHGAFAAAPVVNRAPLDQAAAAMRGPTRRWLEALGRPAAEVGEPISLPTPLDSLPPDVSVPLSSAVHVTTQRLQFLASHARLTHVGAPPAQLLLPGRQKVTKAQQLEALHLGLCGPVLVLYDNDFQPLSMPPTVAVCSIAGINFSYSQADASAFTCRDEDDGPKVINKPAALAQMRETWTHALTALDSQGSEVAVLCAIGCGAFRGKFGAGVPRLWAEALHGVLATTAWTSLRSVVLSLPTFGEYNNYGPFASVMRRLSETAPLTVSTVLSDDVSMVALAIEARRAGVLVGILNPSDVEVLRHGYAGMYWDGGHIALEEVLAMQTTLLLHHGHLNPALFTDRSRRTLLAA